MAQPVQAPNMRAKSKRNPSYDLLHREFSRLARQLAWPQAAMIKDFRHLFSTVMANGGVPEHERRYLLGHAPGRDAIHAYTHLNKMAEHYRNAIDRELRPVLDAVTTRLSRLAIAG